jgi:hypothetical protein
MAEDSLLELFQKMAAEDEHKSAERRDGPAFGHSTGADAPFGQVVGDWISYIEAGGRGLRVSTAYEYARMARTDSVPALGELKLADIDIKTCADYLHGIIDGGRNYAKADHNRAVLSGVLTWCGSSDS